jgi:teichuronic acid biosynthesis glycosyltransferase TuaC
MKILVVANTYPSLQKPNYGAFVYNLVQEIAKEHEVVVITPFKVFDLFKKKYISYGNEKCKLYRPMYLSIGNSKLGKLDLGKISSKFSKLAFERSLKKIKDVDVVYAHFLVNGVKVLDFVEKNKLPLVIASGESYYTTLGAKIKPNLPRLKEQVSQFICVSKNNVEGLKVLGFSTEKMTLVPNAVDYDVFKPIGKDVTKTQIGLKPEDFVVGFIGHFIHRKGPNRIIRAIKNLNEDNIKLVCVGSGEKLDDNDFTLILPPIPNGQLNAIYNAFDVFVLPTLSEGHCNVIEEAKACGVPIISSKGTSVENQINEQTGILVDPLSISEIENAISKLYKDKDLRANMVENLLNQRNSNSLKVRAEIVLDILKASIKYRSS